MSVPYYIHEQGVVRCVRLPDPSQVVLGHVRFGAAHVPFTPAFWLAQAHEHQLFEPDDSAGPRDLAEAATFCLLGGYGIPEELAAIAFAACGRAGLITSRCEDASKWRSVLATPMRSGERLVRYRFPNQKAKYLAQFMTLLRREHPDFRSGVELRDWLRRCPGIGPKTAGWIARNVLGADDVAIVDIHLFRAMRICGVFPSRSSIARDYPALEHRFISFCGALGVRPSRLDLLIWRTMRDFGQFALRAFRSVEAPRLQRAEVIGPRPMLA